MNPQRLLCIAAAGAFLWALPAVLGAAPRAIDGHVVVRPPSAVTAPVAKVVGTQPAAPVFTGNLSRAAGVQHPAQVESPRPQASPGISRPNVSASAAARSDFGPLGLKPAAAPVSILFAIADTDDPAYRAAVSAITGGPVDYFDANAATPTAVQLAAYTCVYTHPNSLYQDPVLLGDRLADYVDAGGKVILGPFCTYDFFALKGRIRTAPYSPVTSPGAGSNHYSVSAYAGDGFRSMHAGVLAFSCTFRDFLVTQGAGIANGHYADGEIACAYRPDGRVIYCNGAGEVPLSGAGDWAKLIANAARGKPAAHGMLMAPSDDDDPPYRGDIATWTGGVVDFFDASVATPSAALLNTYDCVYTWANNAYSDRILMGDRLADRVDAGGRTILGAFSTYTVGNSLGGRIMTPDYCPVTSPAGTNHYSISQYAGDGSTQFTNGVVLADCTYRDYLIGQGAGTVNGHYMDGEIMVAYRPDGRVSYYNGGGSENLDGTGDWARLIADGCEAVPPVGRRILYAPSNSDDPAFRARITENTGAVVDYFDASAGTPTALLMSGYDCVYTWVNGPLADRVLFGDRLADYVDAGGKVILGSFCTFTGGNSLGGRIMTAGYSPVTSLTGSNHFSSSSYVGDAATCFIHGINLLESLLRDELVAQGDGQIGGHYSDLEIAYAYRPDRRVVYVNGLGITGFGSGDWARLIANGAECGDPPGVLFASNDAGQLYTLDTKTGASTFDLNLPTFGGVGAGEIEFLPNGSAWLQGRDFTTSGMGVSLYDGSALTGLLATPRNFNGVEYALGRLYGVGVSAPCGGATLSRFDPATGVDFEVLGPSGPVPIVGLAFDSRWSIMYGITGGCAGPSSLMRIDVTNGSATLIGTSYLAGGGIEFGADRDLYMGGEGGGLFRLNQMTGFTRSVGSPAMGAISGLTVGIPSVVAASASPAKLQFSMPYPNPSRGTDVQFRFSVPQACDARLDLYDVAGRLRWSRALPGLDAGPHSVSWNGFASDGARLPSGVYHMLFTSPAGQRSVRVVRLN